MAATIKIKNSSTAGAAPTSSDLVQGELAVNVTDKRLYTENASGTVVELGTNPSVPVTFPDGSASAPSLTNDGDTNTGIFFPAADTVGITTGGSERARVDSSGNLGLGVTPSAWGTTYKAIEMGRVGNTFAGYNGGTETTVAANAYYNAGWKYAITGALATRYMTDNSGGHYWYTAASGTAGNAITFTQAMTLDASGNLGLGVTSPISLSNYHGITLSGSTGGFIRFQTDGGTQNAQIAANSSSFQIECVNTGIPMQFYTGGSERARITSSGNLFVGSTDLGTIGSTTGAGLYNSGVVAGSAVSDTSGIFARRSSDGGVVSFRRDSTQVGTVSVTTTATSYNTSSDYRLKENIAPMTGALAKVALLKPCTYKWNADGSDGEGFIAHELAEVCPQAVTGEKDAVDDNGNPVYQGIDTSFLVATLTAAIKEQQAIITQLQADVAALKG